jgi:hypothetical protein
MCGGAGGVYEKSGDGDGGGNGLERYTRGGKAVGIRRGGEMGREVGSSILPATSEVHSPMVSKLQSPTFGSPVAEMHSLMVEKRVSELHFPPIEKHVAELGGSTSRIEGGSVAEIGGSEIERGVELSATSEVQSRFYVGGR